MFVDKWMQLYTLSFITVMVLALKITLVILESYSDEERYVYTWLVSLLKIPKNGIPIASFIGVGEPLH